MRRPKLHEVLRPRIHFAPQRNWMNDPNGLVFHNGRYHLFFQHNPDGDQHRNMSWGHASSSDLAHWLEHPVAIRYTDDEEIFSGSVVVDEANSSGFGGAQHPPLVAIYTSAHRGKGRQAQSLAYSTDGGMTWTRYAGNPVLDRGSSDFRDPKVFRYTGSGGSYWVMVAVEAADHQVLLYRSDDLKRWTYLSSYGPAGAVGGVWECPDLFPLNLDGDAEERRWVLLISLNPGGVAGGSGTQYVIGQFDGVEFIPDSLPEAVTDLEHLAQLSWLDWGRDCYAGVTFNGLPDHERTLIAWMGNWEYAHATPTAPWRGVMTTARQLALRQIGGQPRLCIDPILPPGRITAEVAPRTLLRGETLTAPLPATARIDIDLVTPHAVEVELVGTSGSATLIFDGANGQLSLDRRNTHAIDHPGYPSVETAPSPTGEATLRATIVLDSGSVEVFADEGARGLTDLVFLGQDCTLTLHTTGEFVAIEQLRITDLTA
ncbi:glycoside hydrolase family 32 protein [Microbacterium terrisoli]|uniref:glycoside hydrolase family 32 protein n=1 Tax=Microbacterium terrisoli TaxID=3242192 RepID=UPI00280483AC|nr:glycoside hydrolase family 32 protein [Microbacterium protaetiae]